ncbi:MAG: twin-arginine translocase TatA/TatE family subunit, partial [Thermoplasmata archaeon]
MPFGAGRLPIILILLVVALIVMGPSKLPELGAGMG